MWKWKWVKQHECCVCDNVFCSSAGHPCLQSSSCIIHMYFQATTCWSTPRYSYLMTPAMHLHCNWYTALHKQIQTKKWLSEQPLTAKMIFKWFLQDMNIIDSTIITHASLCCPPSISSHLIATVVAFFPLNSCLYHWQALHRLCCHVTILLPYLWLFFIF